MSESLVIRSADADDIELIGFLAQQIWPEAYGEILSRDQLDYMLQLFYQPDALLKQMKAGQIFFIAEEDTEAIGFISYSRYENNSYKIHKCYVLPSLQGKGVGKALIEVVTEEVIEKGGDSLILNVNRMNKAIQFYQKLGFEIESEQDLDIGANYFMNDYVMKKNLSRRD